MYDFGEFGMKDCLTISSPIWKLLMFLGQDEPYYTSSHPCTRHFIRQACYGGRVGASRREHESTAITSILNVIELHLKSNSDDICNLMEEYEKQIDVYREKNGSEYDKFKGADKDYRLSNKEKKEYFDKKIALLSLNEERVKKLLL